MKVVIFSKTPLAAAPFELWKALLRYTSVQASLLNATTRYPDGRTFPHDLVLGPDPRVPEVLREADLFHVHNYPSPVIASERHGRPLIAQFHSVPRLGDWRALMNSATASYTIRQPLQEREYDSLPALPNIIDPDEYRPEVRDEQVTIGFAPTSRAPIGVPCSKGRAETLAILRSVAEKRHIRLVIIEGMAYEANLAAKRRCHILVDDVVTGNWHRTSLEGACFGCVVLNRSNFAPWVHTTLATLEERLLWLIDSPAALADLAEGTRSWVESEWHGMDMVREYVTAYEKVLR